MTRGNKWDTLVNLRFAFLGEKEEKKEEPAVEAKPAASKVETPGRVIPPQSAKPPPP